VKIVLTNLGSVGDIQPLLALGDELRRHGHRPVLALAPLYRSRVIALGLEHVPLGPDLDYPEIDRQSVAALATGGDPLEILRESLELLDSMLPGMLDTTLELCRTADLVVAGHLQPAAQMAHELTQIPFASVQVNHFGGRRAPAERQALASVINRFRSRHGLAPLEDPLHSDANSPQLALYAVSRHLGLATEGWPAHWHVTGFFFLDEREWEPPADLVRFLESGPAPAGFSISSLTHADPEAVTDTILEAVRRTGCRAIVQRGWSGLAAGRMPEGVYAAGFLPHAWLFPRAACVVHHGGAQSSAAVFRAGVPAVVVPYVRDQPIWAELSRDLGVAGPPLPAAELSGARLAAALRETLGSASLREAAASLGVRIRSEGGVERARELIEELSGRVGLHAGPVNDDEETSAADRLRRAERRAAYRSGRRERVRPGHRELEVELT
jgi:sterol 3beta-glucosyltransferase